nr:protein kinase [Fodinicola feengrottensis]
MPATRAAKGGDLVAGRYRLARRVGSGGMAEVWQSVDSRLGRQVAVKLLHEACSADEQCLDWFRREARAAARVHHPGVVQVYDYSEGDEVPYLAMELVDGPTLAGELGVQGPVGGSRTLGHRLSGRGGAAGHPRCRGRASRHQAVQSVDRRRSRREDRRFRPRRQSTSRQSADPARSPAPPPISARNRPVASRPRPRPTSTRSAPWRTRA